MSREGQGARTGFTAAPHWRDIRETEVVELAPWLG